MRFLKKRKVLWAAIVILFVVLGFSAIGPQIASYDPNDVFVRERLEPPSRRHWLGTDNLGRDMFSRLVYGARLSMLVGALVVSLTLILGGLLGLVSGYFPHVDRIVMRLVDGLMAFPSILLGVVLMAVMGHRVSNIVLALTVVYTPRVVRVIRSSVLKIRGTVFVEAAHAIGVPVSRILLVHILPNCVSAVIVQGSFIFAYSVIGEASLSFLGVGVPRDVPSWGMMLNEGKDFFRQAVGVAITPGIAIMCTVFALNTIGDCVRDFFDPRMRNM